MVSNQNVIYDTEFLQRYLDLLDEKGYPVAHKVEAVAQIQSVFDVISEGLSHGRSVSRQGFGKFEVRHRQARNGRNPQTGEKIALPASNSVGFKPGKKLREEISGIEFKDVKGHRSPIVR